MAAFDDLLDQPTNETSDNLEINTILEDEQNINTDNYVEPVEPDDQDEIEDNDLSSIEIFLKERGVRDGKTIVYQNEDGEEEEVNFNELSKSEQLEVLKNISDPGLTSDEIITINYLRSNKISIDSLIEQNRKDAISKYIAETEKKIDADDQYYTVDDYSDDELFLIYLKSNFPTLTEEEYETELALSKSNESHFNKKLEAIREDYKNKEIEYHQEQEQERINQYDIFKNNLIDVASKFNQIPVDFANPNSDALSIDNNDKNRVLSYILDQTENGTSKFFNDLNDPSVLMELAWFKLYGYEAISQISNYWKDVLTAERKNNKQTVSKHAEQHSKTTVKNTMEDSKQNVSEVFKPFHKDRITPFTENQIKYETF